MSQAGTAAKSDARWYIVHTYSNFERKVADEIKRQTKLQGLEDLIEEVMVPTEEVIEVRRGQKVNSERKFLPGYVLLKAKLTDEAYHLVKNVAKVTGFLGQNNKPMPLRQGEVDRIINQVHEGAENPKPSITFEIGELVRVADGPFTSFNGVVEEVDDDRSRLKVGAI
jgi:transcriptional antiterminator NusG